MAGVFDKMKFTKSKLHVKHNNIDMLLEDFVMSLLQLVSYITYVVNLQGHQPIYHKLPKVMLQVYASFWLAFTLCVCMHRCICSRRD